MTLRFDNRVAIVTGAGGGLGRAHALELARRGAKVVINDLGGDVHGEGGSVSAAQKVVDEIKALGGEAIANGANVTKRDEVQKMVEDTLKAFGRIDVLVNNAGILRDKSFAKMDMADWDLVLAVHLTGSANCTKAVWDVMREQNYGRVVITCSSTGLYGNFGQANYGAAKLGLMGLMKTLAQEGAKFDIKVNGITPVAATRMTESLMPPEMLELLKPELVTPAVVYLCSEEAPTQTMMCAGAGSYAIAQILESEGVAFLPEDCTVENVAANFAKISDMAGAKALATGNENTMKTLNAAAKVRGMAS